MLGLNALRRTRREVTRRLAAPYSLALLLACAATIPRDSSANSLPVQNAPSTITQNTTWSPNAVYLIACVCGGTTVAPGVTLTILPGTIVKFKGPNYAYQRLFIAGTLIANGTPDNPIVFTSWADDRYGGHTDGAPSSPEPGDWGAVEVGHYQDAIHIYAASASLSYCIFSYGGLGYTPTESPHREGELWIDGGSTASVTACTFENSAWDAINVSGATSPSISFSNLVAPQCGVRNLGSGVVSAANNWWGSPDGPSPQGAGSCASSGVDFTPWLTAPPVGPAFAITAATFDKNRYQNGVETAYLTVVTKSNWGTGSVNLAAQLTSVGGTTYSLGSDAFTMTAGGQHTSSYSFAVPSNESPWSFSRSLSLTQGGSVVACDQGYAFTGTPLSADQINQQVQQLNDCAILPHAGGLLVKSISLAEEGTLASPVIGGFGSAVSYMENSCRSEAYRAVGDTCREQAANVLAGVALVSLGIAAFTASVLTVGLAAPMAVTFTATALGSFGIVTAYIGSSTMINSFCTGSSSPMAVERTTDFAYGQGDKIQELAATVPEVADSLGYGFSAHIGIQGPAKAKVTMPIGWITSDSSSIDESAALVLAPDTLQWITIGSRASRLAVGLDTSMAATDSLWPKTIVLKATKAGKVFLGIASREVGASETEYAYYPGIEVRDSSSMWVTLASPQKPGALSVDFDGDGQADSLYYVDGHVTEVPVGSGGSGLGVFLRVGVAPNPFTSRTLLAFDLPVACRAKLAIFDVSGRRVATVVDQEFQAGSHVATWTAAEERDRAGAGVYFARLVTPLGTTTRTLIRLR